MSTASATNPPSYRTNTDEADALSLDMAPELAVGELVDSAACELTNFDTGTAAPAGAYPAAATVAAGVVTQRFDARVLTAGVYRWIWNVTINTGAVRSYPMTFYVESHD